VATLEPLVISIPPRELAGSPIPGSVFDLADLSERALSADLRLAIDVIVANRPTLAAPVLCVARPEIFTHGVTLDWLKDKLGSAREHICLSDGTSVKLIPYLENHVLTYGLHSHRRHIELRKLAQRAPEIFLQFRTQINSFRQLASKKHVVDPPTRLMLTKKPLRSKAPWFYGFYLNRHSLEDSAERMLGWGALAPPDLDSFENITYIPLTDCASRDPSFQKILARLIAGTYFDSKTCLLIRLPVAEELAAETTVRMITALDGIRAGGLRFPQVQSRTIFLLNGDLPEEVLSPIGSRLSLIVHETFEFWRYTHSLYKSAARVMFYLDDERKYSTIELKPLVQEAFGGTQNLILATRPAHRDFEVA
jgi:hypothetical protein